MMEFSQPGFLEPLRLFWERFRLMMPNLLFALIILVAGVVLALLVRELVSRGLRLVKFDRLATRMGLAMALERVGGFHAPSRVVGQFMMWFVVVFAILGALYELDTDYTRTLVERFLFYLPNLIVGLFILLLGALISRFFARGVLLAAVNAGMRGARLMAGLVRFLVMALFAVAALEQIGIGRATVLLAFGIVFGGVVLALAIAFGLGGRDLARDLLEGQLRKRREEEIETEGVHHL